MSTAVLVCVPLVASAAFGALGPPISRRLPPRPSTWLLSVGSLLLTGCQLGVLGLVVLPSVGQLRFVARFGHWSARRLTRGQPFDRVAAVVAAVVLVVELVLLLWAAWRTGRAVLRAWMACRGAGPVLVVLPDAAPTAYAVPGWPGRIVTSAGLLHGANPAQRQVVLAHEQAHLDGRHDLHLAVASIAAGANPVLAGIPAAVRFSTERWADEVAAAATGDRLLVARTIGWAATSFSRPHRPGVFVMGAAGADVPGRVGAMLNRPPRRRLLLAAMLVVIVGLAAGAALAALADTKQLFEAAEGAYRAATGGLH